MAAIHLDRAGLGELADVGTGDKALLTTGENDRTHPFIAGQGAKDFSQLFAHCAVERVLDLGPLDPYDSDGVIANVQSHYSVGLGVHTYLLFLFR
ncbi:hypothetical protein D3C87_1631860 [compost metagenome]